MVEKFREGELYDSMAPLPTNCEQMAVHPLVLLTFGPLRRCRYGTGIVAVELAADPLVVMVFRRLRCCQDDQHVDCRCQKGVRKVIKMTRVSTTGDMTPLLRAADIFYPKATPPSLHRRSTCFTLCGRAKSAPQQSVDYRYQKGVKNVPDHPF